MPLLALLCLLAAGTCAAIASGKNRNPLGWAVIGFLLPVIGVVLILVLDSPPPADPRIATTLRRDT